MNFDIENLTDFNELNWEEVRDLMSKTNLADTMNEVLNFDFEFISNSDLKTIKRNFLDKYDLALDSFRGINDKNVLIFVLFVK